jgi:DtxR family Mn-dependent transcriptional regulator
LAQALKVSPGTVTSMFKTLAEAGLAEYRPYEGVCLTPPGRTLALRMLRRHRLIELFLSRTLELSWDQVHEEAENMEHAVSDFLIDRIDDYLGRPAAGIGSPCGSAADGVMRTSGDCGVPLDGVPAGQRVRLVRVTQQGPEFLRFLAEAGLQLEAVVTVLQNSVEAGTITLTVDQRTTAIGHPAARQILVEVLPGAN